MMLSTPSSLKLVQGSMFLALSSWILSQQLSTKFEQVHIDNFFIRSSLYLERKMRPTTMHEGIIPLGRKSWISVLTVYVNWRTTAQAFKDFSFSMLWEVAQVLVSVPCYSSGSLWTMAKSQNWGSLSIQVRRYPLRLLNLTTLCCLLIRYLSTRMLPLCW